MFQIAKSGIILISIFADRPGEGGAWKSEPDKTYSKKKLGSRKHSDIVCLLEIRVSKKLVFFRVFFFSILRGSKIEIKIPNSHGITQVPSQITQVPSHTHILCTNFRTT